MEGMERMLAFQDSRVAMGDIVNVWQCVTMRVPDGAAPFWPPDVWGVA